MVDIDDVEDGSPGPSTELEAPWNPLDLYDIAITASRLDQQASSDTTFECAAVQSPRAATHISVSSYLLTQDAGLHSFIANTLMNRWVSLKSFKLSCQSRLALSTLKTFLYIFVVLSISCFTFI